MSETRSVVVRLSMEASNYIREAQTAGKVGEDAMGKVEKSALSADKAVDRIGSTAGKVAAGGFAALLGTGKAAMDWESQWAGVEKTVDGTTGQMAALEDQIRGLATSMPATHQEIAATAEAAGQLGVAREDVAAFTETMVMLGETTNVTSDDAATSIAQFMNVMRSASDDVDEIGNTLVDLGNKGASTEKQILDMAQRLSGAGSLVGATEADVLALASAMANLGVESELGGGAIQRVFTNIYRAAAEGEEGLAGFAEVADMTASDFAEQWANDPIRAFDAFLQGLGRIKAEGGDVIGTLDELGIEGTQNLQVMLRLAGAGDMLTTSLDQSSSAWEQNTALTDEYGKRADTTAARVQVSWNRIKDAAIEAGGAILPVVADVAEGVGTVADVFGDLPDPVQEGVVLAVAALTGAGGLMWATTKVIGGVTSFRESLNALPGDADRGTRALKGLAVAGTAVAGIGIAAEGIRAIQDAIVETLPGIEQLKGDLLDLRGGDANALSEEFDSIGESIDRIANKDFGSRLNENLLSVTSLGILEPKSLREATAEVEALDSALAGLVASAGPEAAAQAFMSLYDSGLLTASQLRDLGELLPHYQDALDGAANDTRLQGDAASAAAGGVDELGGALADAGAEAEDFGDKMDRLNEKLSGRADMRSYEASLDDFTKSLRENGRTFDINTEKGRNNQAALDNIASTALKVAENMGQADRQKFLSTAIGDLRRMAQNMGVPKSEVNKLIGLLREANSTDVKPKIDVETGDASNRIRIIRQQLESIDRFIPVNIHVSRTGAGGDLPYVSGGQRRAGGGLLRGPGTGTSDEIPILASNGEYVIKAAAVQKYGVDMFDGYNAMRYADGGSVDKDKKKPRKPRFGWEAAETEQGPSAAWIRHQLEATDRLLEAAVDQQRAGQSQLRAAEQAEKAAEESLQAAEQQRDAAQAQLDALEQQKAAFADQVRGNFERDPFGSGFNAAIRTLQKDTTKAGDFETLLRQLEDIGLDGAAFGALQASGDISTARGMLARGVEGVNLYESSYAGREAALGSLSGYAADTQFADAIVAQTAAVAASETAVTAMQAAADQAAANTAYLAGRVDVLATAVQAMSDRERQLAEALTNRTDRPIQVFESRTPVQTAREIARYEAAGRG